MTENGSGGNSSVDSQLPPGVANVLASVDAEVGAEIRSIAATGVVRLPWSQLQPVIAKLVELAMDLVAEKEKIILAAALADGNGSNAGSNSGGGDHALDGPTFHGGDGSIGDDDGEEGMMRRREQESSANGDVKGDGNALGSRMSKDAKRWESETRLVLSVLSEPRETAPFTSQRLCEILLNPTKHYRRVHKCMYAIERLLRVTIAAAPASAPAPAPQAEPESEPAPQSQSQ